MRYLPHTSSEIADMLKTAGFAGLEALFDHIPADVKTTKPLALPNAVDEWELKRQVSALAGRNATPGNHLMFLGAGCYEHHVPAVVTSLMGRSEFVTAYTPYQPEASQGTLQAVYEYQTMAGRLLGMDVANASLYDGASALAEALLMAIRVTKRNRVAVSKAIHPHYRQVAKTYLSPGGHEMIELPYAEDGSTDLAAVPEPEKLAAIAVQSPNVFGCVEPFGDVSAFAKARGALAVFAFTEPLAFGLLKNPGSQGADIACGEGRSFGLGMSAGGMTLGMFAAKQEYVRQMPGRLIGMTVDLEGRRGFVLTLSTREQHIRREKATSNICSNQSLCALGAAQYLAALGKTGITQLARINYNKSEYLKRQLVKTGCRIRFSRPTFNEFAIEFPKGAPPIEQLYERNIIPGLPLGEWYPELENCWLVCATETKSRDMLDFFAREVQSCMKS